jgi:Arsenical resistance operon protein ArsD
MASLQVFDRPLCCSTGVCGPEVDPALVALAADLAWLARKGVAVERINPAQQPQAFAANPTVLEELHAHGNDCLPLVLVEGVVVSRGQLPGRVELAAWTGVPIEATVALPVMTESCCDSEKSGPSAGCC